MKAYIVTLFNSFNFGAYLQAYALGQVLKNLTGIIPIYIDTGARSIERSYRNEFKSAVKHLNPSRISFANKKRVAFLNALKNFSIENLVPEYYASDLIVFGSDEILNTARKAITDYPALWGAGFDGGYRVAYAPSANGADFLKFENVNELTQQLKQFKALSARDTPTANSIENLVNVSVQVVCDPTLLIDLDNYREKEREPNRRNYLLVYSYGLEMTKENIAEIKGYARSHGLKTISAGTYLSWCDESLPCGPFEFLGLVDKADCVVTDTFHGSVFATIYGKKFASYGRSNSKVVEYLQIANLQDRNPINYSSLAECLELCNESDYLAAHQLSNFIRSSHEYLQNAITEMNSI